MQKNLILAVLLSLSATAAFVGTATASQPVSQPASQRVAAADASKDVQLAKDVEDALKPQAEQLGAQLKLAVKDGQVLLSGAAPSEEVIRQLVELASTVPGVTQVSSEIEVKPV
jgi:osmotically-inducible protein OsmY